MMHLRRVSCCLLRSVPFISETKLYLVSYLSMSSWRIFLLCVSVQVLGFVVFLKGFFPPKVVLDGFSEFDDLGSPFTVEGRAQFEKVIVMVVDAMRSDFMYSENSEMKFLHSLIEGGQAIPFTAYSHPPTVTLPRLKGITTGGAPSFVDAILNVADDKDDSQGLSNTDSWIFQFKNKGRGKNLHFFGDDTWLKLFPPADFFEKYEGTNSFFVSDFTEVDLNVTRHLKTELDDVQWDALILHYLGLDHIGHKGGPNSAFMKPKQREMDQVLEELYASSLDGSEDTLIVLLGDHGMNDIGNHGGSSPGETNPGLTFISPKFSKLRSDRTFPFTDRGNFEYFSLISQVDLVPSLAALLDFPIPKNNLGIIIPEILDLWNKQDRISILMENCKQLMKLLRSKFSKDTKELWTFENLLSTLMRLESDEQDYFLFLKEAQSVLAESATNYSYFDITLGAILILCSTLLALTLFAFDFKRVPKGATVGFCICSFLFSLHYHGSSLIEEEHQLWWFFTIIFFLVFFLCVKPSSIRHSVSCLLGVRLVRAWNDSGQKVQTSFTISNFLANRPTLLWILIILTYTLAARSMLCQLGKQVNSAQEFTSSPTHQSGFILRVVAVVSVCFMGLTSLLFKVSQYLNDGNSVPGWAMDLVNNKYYGLAIDISDKRQMQSLNLELSRIFFFSIAGLVFARIILGKACKLNAHIITDLFNLICFLLMHQSRAEIIPIFTLFEIIRRSYRHLSENVSSHTRVVSIASFVLCMQNLSFFSIGNTNLLATVDLSNAYNGVGEYNVFLVALMTFISNYAVVIFWSLSGLELLDNCIETLDLTDYKRKARTVILTRSKLTQLFYGISMLNLVGSCINLRFHLFIWSVFSPKLLYFGSWMLLVNLALDLFLPFVLMAL